MSALGTATRLRVVELLRRPRTLVGLLVLPPVVVEMYGTALASFPQLPTLAAAPATVGRTTGALFAAAFLAGLVGLFQLLSARSGDERAAVAGLPRHTMLAARLVTVTLVAVAASVVTFTVLWLRVDVAAPGLAFASLVAAGLLYGLLGVFVGTVVPRELEGSIVLVFLADVDNALSSGLFPVELSVSLPVVGEVGVTDLAPLAHPQELFTTAVFEGTYASGHLAPTLAWMALSMAAALLAYSQSTGGSSHGLAGRVTDSLGRWAA